MNSLMDRLHDIEGLDPISWWPLAIGWWVFLVSMILIAGGLSCFIAYRIAFKRSWKNDALQKLAYLEANLTDTTARETLIALSEYIRRIALRRFSRKECAGLTDEAWLKWLAMHDPKNFDWEKRGTILIELPYAPLNYNFSINQIRDLIEVVKQWVR
jgi:hypothetical protein